MKKIFFLTSIVSLLFVSCTKESGLVPEVKERVSLKASIEDLTAKTDYTISGSTATFKWSGTEVFGRLIRATADETTFTTYSTIDYTSTSELDAASGVFSGEDISAGYADSELAIYPINKTNGANVSFPTSGTNFTLTLNESLTYDAANPLKDIVPMIGKLDAASYTFKPLTGVLAVKATNIPSTANKITISSTGKGLSGTTGLITGQTGSGYKSSLQSQLYDAAAGLPLTWFSSAATKSYSFSGLSPANTYTFYFPLPTGTLSDLTVTFYKDNTVLYTVTTNTDITITRGHITPLKLITMPKYKVTVGGTVTAPVATFYRENATVFFTVSASADELAKASYIKGMKFTHDPNAGNDNITLYSLTSSAGLSGSGLRYLHYVVAPVAYKGGTCAEVPDGEIIFRGKVPFYFLSSDDNTSLIGTYTQTGGNDNKWGSSSKTNVVKIAVSDNIALGNIMITHFCGRSYDLTEMSGGESSSNIPGKPVYGVVSGSSITFKALDIDGEDEFFTDYTGQRYIIAGGDSTIPYDTAGTVSAANDIYDFSYTIDTSSGTVLSNSGLILLKFLSNSTHSWTRFWTIKDQVLTKQ